MLKIHAESLFVNVSGTLAVAVSKMPSVGPAVGDVLGELLRDGLAWRVDDPECDPNENARGDCERNQARDDEEAPGREARLLLGMNDGRIDHMRRNQATASLAKYR